MNTIEMVANIGGQKRVIGKCSSAQARILVKQEHAAWDDGKLLLPLDPELLRVAMNHEDGPLDDANVSPRERERRVAWLVRLVGALAVSRTCRSDIDQIAGRPVVTSIPLVTRSPEPCEPESGDAEWYVQGADAPDIEEEMWFSSPVVAHIFGVPAPVMGHSKVYPPMDMTAAVAWLARFERVENIPEMRDEPYGVPRVVSTPAFNPARRPREVIMSVGRNAVGDAGQGGELMPLDPNLTVSELTKLWGGEVRLTITGTSDKLVSTDFLKAGTGKE